MKVKIHTCIIILLSILCMNCLAGENHKITSETDFPVAIIQNWLHQNSEAVEVCVYREQWIAPTDKKPKGMLIKFATITRIHKGSLKVGEKISLSYLIEYSRDQWQKEAILRPNRISQVDGELMVSIFNKKDTKRNNGFWDTGDTISRFPFNGQFHKAFLFEKLRDPKLKGKPH